MEFAFLPKHKTRDLVLTVFGAEGKGNLFGGFSISYRPRYFKCPREGQAPPLRRTAHEPRLFNCHPERSEGSSAPGCGRGEKILRPEGLRMTLICVHAFQIDAEMRVSKI